jgi:hypothetical protein
MKTFFLNILLFNLLLLFTSCEQDLLETEIASKTDTQNSAKVTSGIYQSDQPYNLNVVYFVPSDVQMRPEYERRISEFILAAQEYYRQNMHNWGYSNRTFGVLKNPLTNRVKITIVHAANPMSTYSASSYHPILSEVNAWFAAHPFDKTSEHTIVFTAVPTPETPIPFVGNGTSCFVGDNEAWDYQNFNKNTPEGTTVKWYMGGFLHELGHGLGLPHDALPKSQQNVPGYGTSLMSWGNSTYGYSSTILTKSSCAILNNIQVFATTAKPFYGGNKSFTINQLYHSFENGRIRIWGTYTTSQPINAINTYFSPNNQYYAVSSVADGNLVNSFSTYVDISDLYYTNTDYQFIIQAQFPDGGAVYKVYNFPIVNGIPKMDFQTEVSRTGWTISSSSAYPAYPASFAIDGNLNTYWHTNYSPGVLQTDPVPGQAQTFPYFYDINMGAADYIWGLVFTQHQGLARNAKNISVYTRASTAEGWTHRGNYDLKKVAYKQNVLFSQALACRYIRIVFNSSYDGEPYIAMAEIGALK